MAPTGKDSTGEIQPLRTWTELANWKEPEDDIKEVINVAKLSSRLSYCFPQNSNQPTKQLKTLICHDMKGGYLDDRFYGGTQNSDAYRFYHWSGIDTFVYFSHNFVTIPPPSWINAAHRHGVKMLGTLITEWNDGADICGNILSDDDSVANTVSQLVRIAQYHKFEGWLINIENKISPEKILHLIEFVRKLTEAMREKCEGSEVIWYDSVTTEGKLEWQNELNIMNRQFFDACDGIFLNYTWTPEHLQRSHQEAGAREGARVYVGIDVFGRNFYEGGKFETWKALKMVRSHNLSAAIFAPGWTHETQDDFVGAESQLWGSLAPYLYHKGLCSLPLNTSFCQGFGQRCYVKGKVESEDPWHNLSKQQLQPLWSQEEDGSHLSLVTCEAYNGGGCLGVSVKQEAEVRLLVCGMAIMDAMLVSVWYKWPAAVVPCSFILHIHSTPQTNQSTQIRIIELTCDKSAEKLEKHRRINDNDETRNTSESDLRSSNNEDTASPTNPAKRLCREIVIRPQTSSEENGWIHKSFSIKDQAGWEIHTVNLRLAAPSTIHLGQLLLGASPHTKE